MLLVEGSAMDGMLRTLLHQYWHLQKVTDTQIFVSLTSTLFEDFAVQHFFMRLGVRERIPVLWHAAYF